METQITELAVITQSGAKVYRVGDNVNGKIIETIRLNELHFQGNPFDHYCGYTKEGGMIFSVNCLAPCEVVYR